MRCAARRYPSIVSALSQVSYLAAGREDSREGVPSNPSNRIFSPAVATPSGVKTEVARASPTCGSLDSMRVKKRRRRAGMDGGRGGEEGVGRWGRAAGRDGILDGDQGVEAVCCVEMRAEWDAGTEWTW
jgi:hypothetical protein